MLPFCPLCTVRLRPPALATVPRPLPGLPSHGCAIPTFGRRFGGDRDGCRRGPRFDHAPWRGGALLPSYVFLRPDGPGTKGPWRALRGAGRHYGGGSAWPLPPLASGGSAEHRLRGAALPTLRWRFCVRRRVKWTLALVPDFWTAEQGVGWAATEKDAEGMPRGVGTGLRSRRGAKRRWRE